YRVRAGDGESPVYRVTVIDPPAVQRLQLSYHYPDYSGLSPRLEDGGDVRALGGTRVELEARASKPLAAAWIVFRPPREPEGAVDRLPALVEDDVARASWVLEPGGARSSGYYHLELEDVRGIGNRDPIRYTIEVLADAPPEVAVTDPGRDADLPESQRVAVAVEAADDYGVSGLGLVYRVNDGLERRLDLAIAPARQVRLPYLWDLTELGLLPEDRIHYRAEATDNDAITGPKTSASQMYVFRFPSLYELFDEVAEDGLEQLEQLEELAAEEGEAREYLEELRREVLKSDELTWEQRKELEARLRAEEERARAVEELAQQVAETVDRLEEHGLSSEELLEKLGEIRELMEAVTSPELQEALSQLQRSMEQMSPEDLSSALQQFALDQEAFQNRLDRTLALLRQVHAEQRLEAVARQAADLESRQTQINADLERADDGEARSRLQDQEARLQGDTDRLEQELADLAKAMADLSRQTADDLREAADGMSAGRITGRMGQMRQQLQAQQAAAARRLGEGLEEDLGRLAADLQSVQGDFMAGQKQELSRQMREAMAELLYLSLRQEGLMERTRKQRGGTPAELAAEQFALYQGTALVTERLGQIGQQTLTLSLGLAATLGRSLESMEEAAERLGQLDPQASVGRQTEATGYVNEAVALLRESAHNLEQAATPSGFGEAMQKMMGLSEQQAALNQATQQAMADGSQPGRDGRRGQDLRMEMARLAAEQRRVYRALEELEREVRGHRGMERRVEAIRKEMDSLLRDMERSRPQPRVVQSQERILQRMLDASRSIYSRGFEKKRRSESATERAFSGPDWLPPDLGQSRDRLR
ncbi:DUF4175 family protein, partial [Candidatus Latescibacterota bacterium]